LEGGSAEQSYVVVGDYCAGGHWYKLIFCSSEGAVYCFEAVGRPLGLRHKLRLELNAAFAALGVVWDILPLPYQLQDFGTDGWNCGVWLHVVDELLVDYIDSDAFGSRAFGRCFESEQRFRPMNLRGSGASARRLNDAFIATERDRLREALAAAAAAGTLLHGDRRALLEYFSADGSDGLPDHLRDVDGVDDGDFEWMS